MFWVRPVLRLRPQKPNYAGFPCRTNHRSGTTPIQPRSEPLEILEIALGDRVAQLHDAVSELLAGDQLKRHGTTAGRDQGDSFAYNRGNHVKDELVDLSFVEERRDEASATHNPDVFSLVLPKTGCKRFDWFVDELHPRRGCRWQRTAREHVVLDFWIKGRPGYSLLLKVQGHIARLPAPEDGIDRLIEHTHTVVALRTRTVEPVHRAISPGNEAVGTRGDADDDPSLVNHSAAAAQS